MASTVLKFLTLARGKVISFFFSVLQNTDVSRCSGTRFELELRRDSERSPRFRSVPSSETDVLRAAPVLHLRAGVQEAGQVHLQ